MNWQEKNRDQKQNEIITEMIGWIKAGNYKKKFGALIGEFIRSGSIKERKTFMDKKTNRYRYILLIDKEILERAALYKKISVDLVFRSSQLHQMEFKGNSMIQNLFDLFFDNYVNSIKSTKLLPDFNDQLIRGEKKKKMRARMVCDNLSGATDSYAMRMYRRLFDPEYSSLADLV
jgi:dGTPase